MVSSADSFKQRKFNKQMIFAQSNPQDLQLPKGSSFGDFLGIDFTCVIVSQKIEIKDSPMTVFVVEVTKRSRHNEDELPVTWTIKVNMH